MPGKIIEILLSQEGFRSILPQEIEEERTAFNTKDYRLEAVKKLGTEPTTSGDGIPLTKSLKVGVQRVRCSQCGSVRGGFRVDTKYVERDGCSYSSIPHSKIFPPYTSARKVVDYLNSGEPLRRLDTC